MNPFLLTDPGDMPATGPAPMQAPFSMERVGAPDWLAEQQRTIGTQPSLTMQDWQAVLAEEQARRDAAEQAALMQKHGVMQAPPSDPQSRSVAGLEALLKAAGVPWTSAIPMARAAGAGAEMTGLPDATRGLVRGDAEQFANGLAGVAALGIPAAGAFMKSPLGRVGMGGAVGAATTAAVADSKHPDFQQAAAGGAGIGALLSAVGGAGGNAARSWQAGRQQAAQVRVQDNLNAQGASLSKQVADLQAQQAKVPMPGAAAAPKRLIPIPMRNNPAAKNFSDDELIELQRLIDDHPKVMADLQARGKTAFDQSLTPPPTTNAIRDLRDDPSFLATQRDPAFRTPTQGGTPRWGQNDPSARVRVENDPRVAAAAEREQEVQRRAQERAFYSSRAKIDDETAGPSGLSPKGLREQQERDLSVDKHVADATGQFKDIAGISRGVGKTPDEANGLQARFLAEHLAKMNDGSLDGAKALVDGLKRRGYDLRSVERHHLLQQRDDGGRFLGLSPEARKLWESLRKGDQKSAGDGASKSNRRGVGDDF